MFKPIDLIDFTRYLFCSVRKLKSLQHVDDGGGSTSGYADLAHLEYMKTAS